ncbi:MAG: divalent-cation tolerance protein CutA [Vicinamibacterales bacterium]
MENASSLCIVLSTWPADAPVEPLLQALVGERLAACVHVADAGTSTYRWDGAVASARERPLAIKTTRGGLAALETRFRALHPYDVPEWLVVQADGSADYAGWIAGSVGPATP